MAVVQTTRWVQALSVRGMVSSSTTVGNAQKKTRKHRKHSKPKDDWLGSAMGWEGHSI